MDLVKCLEFCYLENDIGLVKFEIQELKRKNSELQNLVIKLNKERSKEPSCSRKISTNTTSGPHLSNSYTISATTIPGQSTIPQLDGGLDKYFTHQDPVAQPCYVPPSDSQCEHCGKPFKSKDDLELHYEANQWGCDECYLCYTSKELADLHELAEHPGTFYALQHIPNSTKLKFNQMQGK